MCAASGRLLISFCGRSRACFFPGRGRQSSLVPTTVRPGVGSPPKSQLPTWNPPVGGGHTRAPTCHQPGSWELLVSKKEQPGVGPELCPGWPPREQTVSPELGVRSQARPGGELGRWGGVTGEADPRVAAREGSANPPGSPGTEGAQTGHPPASVRAHRWSRDSPLQGGVGLEVKSWAARGQEWVPGPQI